jgi:PTH1 family peptidyl-tRNA hydrolase
LGNPGEQFRGTPHNVGQRVIELLAHTLGGEWIREEQAMVARVRWRGADIYLIKPLTDINATGPLLLQLRQRLGFGPAECVLIHDDLDLPFGTVRVRMQGSDGGHRGIRSILEAFRTDALCRVKIGVGRPAQQGQRTDSVMTAFASAELPVIDRACAEAADRCLALVGDRRHRTS